MKLRRNRTVLVTEARRSRDEEFAARKRRYLLTMLSRVVFLLLASVLVRWNVWVAVSIAGLGTILPWIAVMMANDGPPKNPQKMNKVKLAPAERTLEAGPTGGKLRVIEAAEPWHEEPQPEETARRPAG